MLAGDPDDVPDDKEEGNHAERPVPPLVAGDDQSTNETSDDHDLVNNNGPEDGRPGQTGGQEQIHQEQWCGDDPETSQC